MLLPQAAVAKILSTLTKVRQLEGFSYAHSKNGIQTMMLELPMSINGDDGSIASCVVQYVIFPPHSSGIFKSVCLLTDFSCLFTFSVLFSRIFLYVYLYK